MGWGVSLSSVRELESRNNAGRNKLIQTISSYLDRSGVKAVVIQKPAIDSFGITVTESVIQLKEQRIESINLFKITSAGCGESGEALRFQYKLLLGKEVPREILPKLKAQTKTIKMGKVLGLFGGKVTEVKWTGQELAETLNRDPEISKVLLKCTQIWGEMEITTAAISSSEVFIYGPWFTNPSTIISLYSPDRSYEEQNCVFGYQTIDKIARRIHEMLLNIKFWKLRGKQMSHTNPKHLVTEDEIKESLRTIVLNVMNKPIIEPLSYLKLLA